MRWADAYAAVAVGDGLDPAGIVVAVAAAGAVRVGDLFEAAGGGVVEAGAAGAGHGHRGGAVQGVGLVAGGAGRVFAARAVADFVMRPHGALAVAVGFGFQPALAVVAPLGQGDAVAGRGSEWSEL